MRPKAIVWFERVLLAALAIDLVNNLLSWTSIAEALPDAGAPPHPLLALVLAFVPTLVGLLFWYFIMRRRNRVAKWLLAVFVAIGTIGFVVLLVRTRHMGVDLMVILGCLSEVMKLFAVGCLFTREASAWLAAGPQADDEALV